MSKAKTPRGKTAPSLPEPDWLRPIRAQTPCGPNLEYDAEYAVLLARLAPQSDAQYGDFIDKPEAPDWADVERECRRLLVRSKDLPLLIWLTRCRTRLGGAAGLCEGLGMLAAIVERYPDEVHPQREIDGEPDPVVRANALAALCDPEGLLSDIRELVISSNTALRLSVKDVERAYAIPRMPDALPAEAVNQQLEDLRAQGSATMEAMAQATALAQRIDQWSRDDLGEEAPNFQPLIKLLSLFTNSTVSVAVPPLLDADGTSSPETVVVASEPATDPNQGAETSSLTTTQRAPASGKGFVGTPLAQREQVRATLRAAQQWIEEYEPSSPVAVLLKQAERLLGKRFAEVAQAIPPELLAKWEAE